MRRAVIVPALAALVAVPAAASIVLSQQQQAALTTIDSVPSSDDLVSATLSVPDDLVAIAANLDGGYEPAVRLRAIHALAVYCTSPSATCPAAGPVHTTLTDLIGSTASAHAGSDLLVLRAAIEADGPLKVATDLDLLVPLLDHPSRDIRAATARALGQLCNTGAINPLRVRYQNESTDQVKLAISATLRTLPCPVN